MTPGLPPTAPDHELDAQEKQWNEELKREEDAKGSLANSAPPWRAALYSQASQARGCISQARGCISQARGFISQARGCIGQTIEIEISQTI